MKFAQPVCPQCGEPPRALKAILRCSVPLDKNSKNEYKIRFHRLHLAQKEPEMTKDVELECGGGHIWKTEVEE